MRVADDILMESLHKSATARKVAEGHRASWRTTKCPGCGQGLKRRVLGNYTILVCPQDGWHVRIPFVMDEARLLGDGSYIPGVTGRCNVKGRKVAEIPAIGGKYVITEER